MASTFTKSILRVGTHRSPDGAVVVTPERLKHWAREHRRLTSAGNVVPMHWDHGTKLEELQPVTLDSYRRQERSARNSVGMLRDFRLAPDGRSAEVVFETRDPSATQKVDANCVYVSPVIMPSWQDGAGNKYRDVITHLDLVNHPVDHRQSPARRVEADPPVVACALRMGLSPKPYRLAMEDPNVTEDDDRDDMADELPPGDVDDSGGEGDAGDLDTAADEPGAADELPDDAADELGEPGVGDLMLALADHGIILPHDTTDANFLDRLRTALIAKKGANPTPDMGDVPADDGNTFDQTGDMTVASPQIATMSLREKTAMKFAGDQYRKTIVGQLDRLLKTGRCTPAEHAEKAAELGTVRLSLDKNGQPKPSLLTHWIASRKTIPAGACWDPRERLRRMSATVATQPDARDLKKDESKLTGDKLDAEVNRFLKRA